MFKFFFLVGFSGANLGANPGTIQDFHGYDGVVGSNLPDAL